MKKLVLFFVLIILASCKSDAQRGNFFMFQSPQPTGPCVDKNIGETFGGGKIAYFYQSGDPGYVAGECHGIIASTSDLDADHSGMTWYNGSYTTTGATATALGTGAANTTTIVTNQGAGAYAASACLNYTSGTYDDWYLPSKDELHKLFLNGVAIGNFYTDIFYWSSSEVSNGYGYYQNFNYDYANQYNKNGHLHVRAIRYF